MSAVLAALISTSCIVVPIGTVTKSPYSPEVMQRLSGKDADRNLVRQALGEPKLVKGRERFWYYTNSRATWGIIGGTSSGVITDDEWLAVRFDEAGRVVFVERNGVDKCLSNGMCLDGTAPTPDDNAAKSYSPKADECGVYLFLDPLPWPLMTGTVKFFVDGKPVGEVNSKTYLFLTHAAGEIQIDAYDLKMSASCVGGTRVYARAVKKRDFSWKTGEDLSPLTAADGDAAIRARRLALPD